MHMKFSHLMNHKDSIKMRPEVHQVNLSGYLKASTGEKKLKENSCSVRCDGRSMVPVFEVFFYDSIFL